MSARIYFFQGKLEARQFWQHTRSDCKRLMTNVVGLFWLFLHFLELVTRLFGKIPPVGRERSPGAPGRSPGAENRGYSLEKPSKRSIFGCLKSWKLESGRPIIENVGNISSFRLFLLLSLPDSRSPFRCMSFKIISCSSQLSLFSRTRGVNYSPGLDLCSFFCRPFHKYVFCVDFISWSSQT